MKKRLAALLFAALMLAGATGLTGCGQTGGRYRVVGDALLVQDCVIAFRSEDKLLDTVNAALKVLTAGGVLRELSEKWFGSDLTTVTGDIEALLALGQIPKRTLIVGIDPNAAPMSFKDSSGQYAGFDVELARRVCELLDWELRFSQIDRAKIELELKSGNVDCVWSSAASDEAASVSYSLPYIKNELVFAVLPDSKIRARAGFAGKTLAIPSDPYVNAALEENEKLKNSFGSIKPLAATNNCFNALDEGLCDVILIGRLSLIYHDALS